MIDRYLTCHGILPKDLIVWGVGTHLNRTGSCDRQKRRQHEGPPTRAPAQIDSMLQRRHYTVTVTSRTFIHTIIKYNTHKLPSAFRPKNALNYNNLKLYMYLPTTPCKISPFAMLINSHKIAHKNALTKRN